MNFTAGAQKCYVTSSQMIQPRKTPLTRWRLSVEGRMAAQAGRAGISWSGWIWLWYFWKCTAWPGQCPLVTERVLPLSKQTSIHLPMLALTNAFFSAVWDWREGAAQYCPKGYLHHFSSKITDGISKCITGCTGLPWQRPGADGGLAFLTGEERWAGQGEGRGC